MFRKSVALTVAAAFTLLLGSGCQKDEDAQDPSGADILTSGQWRLTAAVANPPVTVAGLPISDVYPFIDPCIKDNYYVFDKNGTAELNEGPTKCDPADPQTSTVNWSLSADEKELTIDGETGTVLELTATRLRVRGVRTVQNISATVEATFTK